MVSFRSIASDLLIDDKGTVFSTDVGAMARLVGLSVTRSRHASLRRALALGFISVSFFPSGVRIALRPDLITRQAISRLALVTAKPGLDRVVLSLDGRASRWEIIGNVSLAISRVHAAFAQARMPEPRHLLDTRRLPLSQIDSIAQGQLLPVLRAWEEAKRKWDADFYGRLQNMGHLERTIILCQPRYNSDQLLIEHWGQKRGTYGPQWPRIARGRDFAAQPNLDVGAWRAGIARQQLADLEPSLRVDDAVFRETSGRLIRFHVCRLILPWQTSIGERMLSEVTADRRSIVLERPEPDRLAAQGGTWIGA